MIVHEYIQLAEHPSLISNKGRQSEWSATRKTRKLLGRLRGRVESQDFHLEFESI